MVFRAEQVAGPERTLNPDFLRVGDILEIEDDMDIIIFDIPESGKQTKSIITARSEDLLRYDGFYGRFAGEIGTLFRFTLMPIDAGNNIVEEKRFYTTRNGVESILKNVTYMYNETDPEKE